jgi:hypothetical protein
MTDTPVEVPYSKTTSTREEVEAVARNHLAHGAISSVVSETATDWILTTVWAGGDGPPNGQS